MTWTAGISSCKLNAQVYTNLDCFYASDVLNCQSDASIILVLKSFLETFSNMTDQNMYT